MINSATIRRVGEAANNFDITAQNLPIVMEQELSMGREPLSSNPRLIFDQDAGTTFTVYSSIDLENWSLNQRYLDSGDSSLTSYLSPAGELDVLEKEFYRFGSIVNWGPEASFPSDVDGRTITLNTNVGNLVLDLGDTETLTVGGTAYAVTNRTITVDGYGANLFIETNGLVPLRFRLGADLPIATSPAGRLTGTAFTNPPTSLTGTFSF